MRAAARERSLEAVDATCPLVTKVHAEAARFAARGDTVVLIGHAGHEETEGTLGVAPDSTVLAETGSDVEALELPADAQVSCLTQTTLLMDEAAEIVDVLRARFPGLKGAASEDICYATTNRQGAVRSILDECDVVLVVGSGNSSNSRRLVELARSYGTSAYLIDGPGDIDPAWLQDGATIGVSAGASAPPQLVEHVLRALGEWRPIIVEERVVATETVRFALTRKVRTQ